MRRALLSLALLITACSDGSGPSGPLSGTWTGSMSGVITTINVTQHGNAITGAGTIGGQPVAVAGTYSAPDVTVNLTAPGFPTVHFDGVLSGDTVTGLLNGPGIVNVSYVLTRQ